MLTSYDVFELFSSQLENATGEKVVLTPSSINEKGVVLKTSLLKTFQPALPRGTLATRTARIRVSVCGRAESLTGLRLAAETIEKLDRYLNSERGKRLEDRDGVPVPNSRITTLIQEEDSFMDSPDSTEVQEVQDDRICIITFPWEEEENEERSEVRNEERADS